LDGVPFGDVDLEMHMVFGKTKFAELKPKTFQVMERLDTGINVALFSEVAVSVVCGKHHGYPVVSCVMRWLFIASAIYIFHIFYVSCRTFIGQILSGLPRATKKEYGLAGEKQRCSFSSAGLYTLWVSDHAVFPAATINLKISLA